jgi:hypothetical protein
MLPHSYELPAAIALILGGVLTCFAGYRLFRIVIGIYGFILGAMIASSTVGTNSTAVMVGAALVGGLAGSVVLLFAYIVGVALAGAALGALIGHLVWTQFGTGAPPAMALIIVSIAGAFGAMLLQRYVLIVGTAFGGAWTIVIGAVNALATRGVVTRGMPTPDVWVLYPTSLTDQRWAPVVWILLGLVGSGVQLALTAGKKR